MVPASARILLDLIYRTETGRGPPACYETIFGHRERELPQPITSMTIDELLAAQAKWGRNWGSSAAGAPQIIRATMRDLVARMGLSGSEIYDPDMQDRMAFELLKRRGWVSFLAGTQSLTSFGNALAREWASFPVLTDQKRGKRELKRGQSYYDGDGLNSALIKPALVETTLRQVLEAEKTAAHAPSAPEAPEARPHPQQPPAELPGPKEGTEHLSRSKRFWTWMVTLVTALSTLAEKVGWADLDWRVQIALLAVVALLAIYGIASMPRARQLLGRLTGLAS